MKKLSLTSLLPTTAGRTTITASLDDSMVNAITLIVGVCPFGN
jgi:hypothetical protein